MLIHLQETSGMLCYSYTSEYTLPRSVIHLLTPTMHLHLPTLIESVWYRPQQYQQAKCSLSIFMKKLILTSWENGQDWWYILLVSGALSMHTLPVCTCISFNHLVLLLSMHALHASGTLTTYEPGPSLHWKYYSTFIYSSGTSDNQAVT